MGSLKSRDGKVIGDEEEMKSRWKEYLEELYSEDKRIEKAKWRDYITTKKTNIMTTADWDSFEIDGEEIRVVTSCTFLGSEVEKDGRYA